MLWDNLFYVIASIVVVILGILLLTASWALKKKKITVKMQIFIFAWEMIIAGLWILSGGNYTSLIIRDGVWLLLIEMTFLALENYLLIAYFQTLVKTKAYKLVKVAEWLSLSMLLLFFILQITGVVDAYQIREYYVPMYGVINLLVLGTSIYEWKHAVGKKEKWIYDSVIIASSVVALEIINYAIEIVPKGTFSSIGIFFVVAVHFVLAIQNILEAMERIKHAVKIEKELEESRISIMLSQIQPHFLYNALSTIRYLCNTQPELAGKAIESFAKYLRGNMDSLTKKAPVPFSRELEHLEHYLKIERLRFEKINVNFDLSVTNFTLPALTVQPLVENAIKYGIAPKPEGGTVTIRTMQDETCFYINILDDGIGFDSGRVAEEDRSHIGIQNTRERISAMCGGTLEVNSQEGEGTSVQIIIPKKERQKE